MEDFIHPKTSYLPEVSFIAKTGMLTITGRSVSENPVPFFQSLQNWVSSYFEAPQVKTVLNFNMEFVNSSSAKLIYNIIEIVNYHSEHGCQCEVLWHFEQDDESMEELGLHYQSSFDVPFTIIETD